MKSFYFHFMFNIRTFPQVLATIIIFLIKYFAFWNVYKISFTLKLEVYSSRKSLKWTNQVILCLAYSAQIKSVLSILIWDIMNFENLEKIWKMQYF